VWTLGPWRQQHHETHESTCRHCWMRTQVRRSAWTGGKAAPGMQGRCKPPGFEVGPGRGMRAGIPVGRGFALRVGLWVRLLVREQAACGLCRRTPAHNSSAQMQHPQQQQQQLQPWQRCCKEMPEAEGMGLGHLTGQLCGAVAVPLQVLSPVQLLKPFLRLCCRAEKLLLLLLLLLQLPQGVRVLLRLMHLVLSPSLMEASRRGVPTPLSARARRLALALRGMARLATCLLVVLCASGTQKRGVSCPASHDPQVRADLGRASG